MHTVLSRYTLCQLIIALAQSNIFLDHAVMFKKKNRKIKPMRKENSIKYICFWSDSAFLYYACTDAIQKLDFFKRDVHFLYVRHFQ